MRWTEDVLDELRALLGAGGVLASDAALFTYEADALVLDRMRPDVVVLPRTSDRSGGDRALGARSRCPGHRARRRHRPRRRRDARARRHRAVGQSHGSRASRRRGAPVRLGAARPREPRAFAAGRAARALLRARPRVAAGQHHRRQRGDQRRRAALPQVRRHLQSRARPGGGAARWQRGDAGRRSSRRAGLRSRRAGDRQRGHARDRDGDLRAAAAPNPRK